MAAIAGDRQITLKWRQNTEADFLRYRIYRGTSPHPTTKVDSTNNIADTTKTFTGLTNGTTYYFRITAVDQNFNESGYSNEVSVTPSATDLPPAPPQNLAATAGVAQITLTWNANTESDFLRYRIYGGTNPNPTAKIDSVEGANNTATTLTNLTFGAKYYFRVTAVDQALHASGYSNTVTAKPLADNVAPTLANAVYSEPANLSSEVACSRSRYFPKNFSRSLNNFSPEKTRPLPARAARQRSNFFIRHPTGAARLNRCPADTALFPAPAGPPDFCSARRFPKGTRSPVR